MPFDASDKVVTLVNCGRLVGTLVNRFPLRSIVSIATQAILPTSVATAESVRFFPAQLIVTVVLLPFVNAHVHVFKSAAGGQRQTSFE